MIFNALTLIGLFVEIFSATLILGAAFTFFQLYRTHGGRHHALLSLFLFLQGILIGSLVVTSLSYSLGTFSSALKFLSKLNQAFMILAVPAGISFFGTRFNVVFRPPL